MRMRWLIPLLFVAAAYAQGPPALGQNCTQGCGIGNDIPLASISCHILNNNDPSDTSIPCQHTLAAYGVLPTTYDATQMVFTFTSNHASYGEVRGGAYGVTDAIWDDTTVGTTHRVIVNHIVPAGGASPQAWYGFEVGACQHAFPCNNADATWTTWPGPTSGIQGGHYMQAITPYPASSLPATWEIESIGNIPAYQGKESFATIPILSIMKTGRFTVLPTAATANNLILSASSGQYAYWSGTGWVQTTPQWYLTTFTLTLNGINYTCHPDALGNHAADGSVENTCTSGSSDSGTALVIYYAGVFGTGAQDLRDYLYDSSVGQYHLAVPTSNAPTGNPTPQITLEVYAGPSAITGTGTANLAFTLYTGVGHVAAAPPTTISVSVPVTVKAVTPLPPDPPTTFTSDPNLLSSERWAATSTIRLCSNPNYSYSLLYWLNTINTATWWSIGPAGYWNEDQSWLYDQGRVYNEAEQHFTVPMSGGSFGDWSAAATFGNDYAHLIIKPTANNPNGYYYMATGTGVTGSTQPTWSAHTTAGATFSDGSETWQVLPNQAGWEMCIVDAQNPYVYAVRINGAQSTGQFSQYAGGALESFYQTGDAYPQDASYKTGMYSGAVSDLGVSTGLPAFQNVFSPNAGRGVSHRLEALAMDWRLQHAFGTDSNFTGNATLTKYWRLLINANLNWLYFTMGQSNVGTVDPLDNLYPHADSFYMGIVQNSLITAYNTANAEDPQNVHGLQDERIPQAIKDSIDYEVNNWFDQPFSQQGIHMLSIGFTPHDYQTLKGTIGGTKNVAFNELEGFEVAPISWLYARNGNSARGPGGVGYDTISDQFRLGAFSAYNCSFWDCAPFSDGQWLHGWSAGTGTPKELGMSYKTALANDENWRNGYRAWYELDVDPSRSPCRDGSNGSNPCASGHHSAFADVMPAYPYQLFGAGTTRFSGPPYNQIDPTDCPVPCHFTGDKASPISNVGPTSFTVTAFTAEQATMTISYGPSCSLTWPTEDAGFPVSLTLTNATVWQHQLTPSGLNPSTNYPVKFNTVDLAGNHFSTNCSTTLGGWSGGGLNVTTAAGVPSNHVTVTNSVITGTTAIGP